MEAGNEEGIPSGNVDVLLTLLCGQDLQILKTHVTAGLQLPASEIEFGFTYNEAAIRGYLSQLTKNEKIYEVRKHSNLNRGVKESR